MKCESGNKARMPAIPISTSITLEMLLGNTVIQEKEIKAIRLGKEEIKLICTGQLHTKKIQRNLQTIRISNNCQAAENKINIF